MSHLIHKETKSATSEFGPKAHHSKANAAEESTEKDESYIK